MKLYIALGLSALLHIVWILLWPLYTNVKANHSSAPIAVLEINLTKKNAAIYAPILTTNKRTSLQKSSIPNKVVNQNEQSPNHQDIKDAYLSIKEVDIQALPMNNIDASMLPAAMQNTQIQLRLFIDEFGHVARIEPIKSQLYQDEALETALSEQLTKVSFTPAKRKGVDVKSYQEVAYDFNFYQASSQP